mmetsp:Transcript_18939/g.49291  ORF Transcript_18939/g.49291 Transcript_18939/m.49291 type:complete len:307 (-) Transcript_18939:414-1334(-)
MYSLRTGGPTAWYRCCSAGTGARYPVLAARPDPSVLKTEYAALVTIGPLSGGRSRRRLVGGCLAARCLDLREAASAARVKHPSRRTATTMPTTRPDALPPPPPPPPSSVPTADSAVGDAVAGGAEGAAGAAAVGVAEGTADGAAVAAVGDADVGATDGAADGAVVGAVDGAAVGAAVVGSAVVGVADVGAEVTGAPLLGAGVGAAVVGAAVVGTSVVGALVGAPEVGAVVGGAFSEMVPHGTLWQLRKHRAVPRRPARRLKPVHAAGNANEATEVPAPMRTSPLSRGPSRKALELMLAMLSGSHRF